MNFDLDKEIREALRKGKSTIVVNGKQHSLKDAMKLNSYSKGGIYEKYNDGGGKSKARKTSGETQRKNSNNLYGKVTPELLEETKRKNPWYDWSSFDGSPESIEKFQKNFNELATEGHKIGVDGKFGEETQSAYLEFLRPNVQGVNALDASRLQPMMQTEIQTPDGMWIPKVGSWDVKESIVNPSGFGSHTTSYRTQDQGKIDSRREMIRRDQNTSTGQGNSIEVSPNYTGTQVYQTFQDGGYKKYQDGSVFSNVQNNLTDNFSNFAFQNPFSGGYSVFGAPNEYSEQQQQSAISAYNNTILPPAKKNTSKEAYNIFPQQDSTMYNPVNVAPFTDVTKTPDFLEWASKNLEPSTQTLPQASSLDSELTPSEAALGTKSDTGEGTQVSSTVNKENPYGFDGEKGMELGTERKAPSSEEQKQNPEMYSFNPYAGVDIPSAAAFLGQSIESGNVGMGIASGAKLGLGVARNILGGMGRERTIQDGRNQYRQTQRDNMEGNATYARENGGYFEMGGIMPAPMQAAYQGMHYYEDGGEIPQERLLTGEVMSGVSENNTGVQPNSELEDGEYIHSQDGSSIKVEGRDHEEGGEKMELQEGDRVISNNLKLKKENAKRLKEDFDVNLKAGDTYAKAVDKIYASIGLSKVIKEEEEILAKVEKAENKTEDEATRNLNLEFLYKKLEEISAKKEELEPLRQQALEAVFNLQEESKPKEQQENEMFEDGGVKQLSQRYNISMERAKELIEEFKNGGYKKYQGGGTFKERLEKALQDSGYAGEELLGHSHALDNIPEGQSKKILDELGIQVYGKVNASQVLETVSKNPWYDWDSFDGSKESVKDFQEAYNSKVKGGSKIEVDGKFGEQTQSAYLPWLLEEPSLDEEDAQVAPEQAEATGTAPAPEEEAAAAEKARRFVDIPLSPDQGVIPPSGMASQLNVQRRYDRVDPQLMSPEAIIAENRRQANEALQAAQNLPPAQRMAAIAQINASTQQANNQAISQVEMQNAQIRNQAQAQNAQIQSNEENMRATDALSYEQRQQTAEAKTEENVRQFYDYLRNLNVARFNDERRRNTVNQLYENFNIDSLGNVQKTGEGLTPEQSQQALYTGFTMGVPPQSTEKKKYGGKYKNKK